MTHKEELLCVSHGLVSALVAMKQARGRSMYYHQFTPQRFTRKRAAMEQEVVALDRAYDLVERDLRKIQATIKENQSDG